MDVVVKRGIDTKSIAHAIVTVVNPKQAKILQDSLHNKWIEDKKLKAKAQIDLTYETYNNRTLVVNKLPIQYKIKEVLQLFQDMGSVVAIDLPMKNIEIEEYLKDKVNAFQIQR